TVRVAGESVALVSVMAFLATVSQQALAATLNGYPPQTIASAAAWLGAGHLEQAHTLLPGVPLARLHQSLNQAYQWLCNLLAILTLFCAAMVWKTLRRHGPPPGRP
ncbi:MFS transporter, partial [Cronobacter dublinensis subsp. dublinensis]|nr:MFS transporter [Cronobacter dublinensis subsp. dublinensis]